MLQIRLNDPSQYQSIVDAEWNIIYDKLDKCVQSGAKIVLSRLAIGDLATQYFADRDIFCAGRVSFLSGDCCHPVMGLQCGTTAMRCRHIPLQPTSCMRWLLSSKLL